MLRLKIRQVCLILGLSLLTISFLVTNRGPVTTEGQTQISTLFITLTNGKMGNYVLDLKEGDVIKDRISVTSDSDTLNLNYSPPPGLVINPNYDQICIDTRACSPIPSPDIYGTSSVILRLP